MNKYLFALLLAMALAGTHAQNTYSGSFVHGGITRTYSFYVPAAYSPGQPVPMVIGLHGTSSTGAQFAQYRDFKPIADTANFIVVNPNGSTMLGITFWNYGNVFGSTVDDVGFLEALIDTIASQYSINHQRIYCTGVSNGSFMAYYMACQSNRFAAIAGVTGSMSHTMLNACNPVRPTPTLHIHGTEDNTNPYAGTSTMVGIEQLNAFWINQNNCDTTPLLTTVPNTDPNDGATAEHYVYSGGTNGNTVELYKVIGGEHTWPGGPMPNSNDVTCMDFSAGKEIWRFFNQYQLEPTAIDKYETAKFKLWPNPANEQLNIDIESNAADITLLDMQGRMLLQQQITNTGTINISQLQSGNYLIKIAGKEFSVVRKVVVY
ncbi:MAG TPA: T9SS type A sorting domain-containing protein [Chitinophagales bacterium]|nr:T9SS type A sorting domain-containing protein [Chitinophagales bacterium]